MFKLAKPFFIHVLSPLHAGSGTDLGIVDLPIQREKHTGFPKIESSSLKGAIREVFEEKEEQKLSWFGQETEIKKGISLAFGPEDTSDAHSGALGFTDARILLFPVKSMKGVFAWITCPEVLKRFFADLDLCNLSKNEIEFHVLDQLDAGACIVTKDCNLLINDKVILEEYTFTKTQNDNEVITKLLEDKTGIDTNKLVILKDDDFKDFVNLSTEVITRTKICAETGTVAKGQLFTEEYLPCESVLYSLALSSPIFNNDKGIFNQVGQKQEELVMKFFEMGIPEIIQIGGNATIGKGIVRIKKWEMKNV